MMITRPENLLRSVLRLALAAAGLFVACPVRADNYALILGIDQYEDHNGVNPLKAAVADAKGIGKAFIEVAGFPAENVRILTSDSETKPTKRNILFELDQLAAKVKSGDTVFIFYAGHGIERDGIACLLPYDTDTRTPSTYKDSVLPVSQFREEINKLSVKTLIMAFDMCRTNPFPEGRAASDANNLSAEQARVVLASPPAPRPEKPSGPLSTIVLYACSPRQHSYEWRQKGRGYFSYFLEQGLRDGAADGQGVVKVQYLMDYVQKAVLGAVKREEGQDQKPYFLTEGSEALQLVLATGRPLGRGGQTAVPSTVGNTAKEQYDAAFQRGMELLQENRFEAAQERFEAAIKLMPSAARAQSILGLLHWKKNHDFMEAERLCRKAMELDPKDGQVLALLALLYEQHKENEKAEALYRQALNVNPKDPDLLSEAANFFDAQDNFKEAERLYREAMKLDPKNADLVIKLARVYQFGYKNLVEAEKWYKQAVTVEPGSAYPLTELAAFYEADAFGRLDLKEAERLYRKAVALEPKNAFAMVQLAGFCHDPLHNDVEAEQLYRKALEMAPQDPYILCRLADFCHSARLDDKEAEQLRQKAYSLYASTPDADTLMEYARFYDEIHNFDESVRFYRKAIEEEPENVDPLYELAELYHRGEDPKEAARLYRKAMRVDPKSDRPVLALAEMLSKADPASQEAEQLYRQLLQMDPQDGRCARILGEFLETKGKAEAKRGQQDLAKKAYEEAEQRYREAIRLGEKQYGKPQALPSVIAIQDLAAFCRDIKKDFQEAEKLYLRLVALEPKNIHFLYTLARFYTSDLKDYKKAEAVYRQLIGLDPKKGYAWHELGDLYQFRLNKIEEAAPCYRKAIESDPKNAYDHLALSGCLLALKQRDAALAEAKKAIELGYKLSNSVFEELGLKP